MGEAEGSGTWVMGELLGVVGVDITSAQAHRDTRAEWYGLCFVGSGSCTACGDEMSRRRGGIE